MGTSDDGPATAASTCGPAGERVRRLLRDRIGPDRFAVWFGESAEFVVAADGKGRRGRSARVTIRAGTGFAHEWLRRTFRGDVEAAACEACGPATTVVWESVAEPDATDGIVQPAAAPAGRTGRRRQPAAQPSASPVARRVEHRLDDFVVGPSNRIARGAAELAATRPGEMSPLVIHGPSGVGKTHLLEGLGGRAREAHAGITVVWLSAEQFTTGFLQALHHGGLPGFRRTCRNADLLVIDDLQFFVGKRSTMLELLQTVEALQRQGRQVVFGCDRELDALTGLAPELLARLRGGMTARILPPDYDVRRGIVATLCDRRGLAVPDEVIHYVATHMTRHARELLGAVNRLEATSLMLGVAIDEGMAVEALADLVRSSARSVRLADVERAVCTAFGIEEGSLQSSGRGRSASHPRMLAMFLARKHTHAALAEIGCYFGRRSHSTVIAAQKAVGEWLAKQAQVVLAESKWDVEEAIRRVEDLLRAG